MSGPSPPTNFCPNAPSLQYMSMGKEEYAVGGGGWLPVPVGPGRRRRRLGCVVRAHVHLHTPGPSLTSPLPPNLPRPKKKRRGSGQPTKQPPRLKQRCLYKPPKRHLVRSLATLDLCPLSTAHPCIFWPSHRTKHSTQSYLLERCRRRSKRVLAARERVLALVRRPNPLLFALVPTAPIHASHPARPCMPRSASRPQLGAHRCPTTSRSPSSSNAPPIHSRPLADAIDNAARACNRA